MKCFKEAAGAPKAVGPYSLAVAALSGPKLIFISGQLPLDPETIELVEPNITKQTHRVLENLKAVVKATGAQLSHIVKVTIYLTNLTDHFSTVNEIYASYFPEDPPARACVEVSGLPKGALVEIEAIVAV